MHFDSHYNVHNFLSIYHLACKLAKKYGFISTRRPVNMEADKKCFRVRKRIVYLKESRLFKTVPFCTDSKTFVDHFNYFKKGNVEIAVHPTLSNNKVVDCWGTDYKQLSQFLKDHDCALVTYEKIAK